MTLFLLGVLGGLSCPALVLLGRGVLRAQRRRRFPEVNSIPLPDPEDPRWTRRNIPDQEWIYLGPFWVNMNSKNFRLGSSQVTPLGKIPGWYYQRLTRAIAARALQQTREEALAFLTKLDDEPTS